MKLLGHDAAESTVAKYMIRKHNPPSQTWKTFLKNHLHETAAIDFFTVPKRTWTTYVRLGHIFETRLGGQWGLESL